VKTEEGRGARKMKETKFMPRIGARLFGAPTETSAMRRLRNELSKMNIVHNTVLSWNLIIICLQIT
jgi:hypothetical protein